MKLTGFFRIDDVLDDVAVGVLKANTEKIMHKEASEKGRIINIPFVWGGPSQIIIEGSPYIAYRCLVNTALSER